MEFEYIELTNDSQLNMYIDEILALQHACDVSLPEDAWYIPSDKEELYLSLVCVDFPFRGHGLQYKLMEPVIKLARTKKYKI